MHNNAVLSPKLSRLLLASRYIFAAAQKFQSRESEMYKIANNKKQPNKTRLCYKSKKMFHVDQYCASIMEGK